MAVGAYLAAYPAMQLLAAGLRDPSATALRVLRQRWPSCRDRRRRGAAGCCSLAAASRRLHRVAAGMLLMRLVVWVVVDFSQASTARRCRRAVLRLVARHRRCCSDSFDCDDRRTACPARASCRRHARRAAQSAVLPRAARRRRVLCAAAAGLIVGLPALRLRGDYLAIATLGMAEIIRIVHPELPAARRALGLTGHPEVHELRLALRCRRSSRSSSSGASRTRPGAGRSWPSARTRSPPLPSASTRPRQKVTRVRHRRVLRAAWRAALFAMHERVDHAEHVQARPSRSRSS